MPGLYPPCCSGRLTPPLARVPSSVIQRQDPVDQRSQILLRDGDRRHRQGSPRTRAAVQNAGGDLIAGVGIAGVALGDGAEGGSTVSLVDRVALLTIVFLHELESGLVADGLVGVCGRGGEDEDQGY